MVKLQWNLSWTTLVLSSLGLFLTLVAAPARSLASTPDAEPVKLDIDGSTVETVGNLQDVTSTSSIPAVRNVIAQATPVDSTRNVIPTPHPESSSTQIPSSNLDRLPSLNTDNTLEQVTSVSQLSDVQPTDWAFQALQSLVERYGCIAGYPNRTYRGNRPLSRYEFAAGLNACLDRVNELIATATADLVRKEDLEAIKKLQEQFASELATLKGRVDSLEARTTTLEKQQFSTTTKLQGEVLFVVADTFGDRANNTPAKDTKDNTQTFFAQFTRLRLQTSFSGKDQLTTVLAATNVANFSAQTGTFMTRFTFERQGSFPDNSVYLERLIYRFPIGKKLTAWVGPRQLQPNVFAPNLNPLIGGEFGAVSRLATHNPTIYRPGFDGAGGALSYKPNKKLQLSVGYIADDSRASDPSNGAGLFNGNHLVLGQLIVSPLKTLDIGFTYDRKYFGTNTGFNLTGGTGSTFARNPFQQNATASNNFGLQFNWKARPFLHISGWFGYTLAHQLSGPDNNATIINGLVGFAFPDLFKKGNLGGFIVGVPPKVTSNDFRPTARSARLEDKDTSIHLEAFYTFKLSNFISVTPDFYVITSPEHNGANSPIFVGAIKTRFAF